MQAIRTTVDILVLVVVIGVSGWLGFKAGKIHEAWFGEKVEQVERKIDKHRRLIDWLIRENEINVNPETGDPVGFSPQEEADAQSR